MNFLCFFACPSSLQLFHCRSFLRMFEPLTHCPLTHHPHRPTIPTKTTHDTHIITISQLYDIVHKGWADICRLTYVRVSYVRGSDVRGLMLGVLMLGVQPRMSINGRSGFSNIGGSYVRGWTPNVLLWKPRTSDFEHWNFRTFGVQPRTSEFEGSSFSDIRGSTPNVRIWRIEN